MISETIILALIVAVPAMLSPLLLVAANTWSKSRDRREDFARQDEVARRVAETARVLDESTAKAVVSRALITDKLDVIHSLVNSNMTAAIQGELSATIRELALLREVIDLRRAKSRKSPSKEVLAAVAAATKRIAELTDLLAMRLGREVAV